MLACILVERVVEFYAGKTEEIIMALLEDNLHPEIASLDRNMPSKAELEQSRSQGQQDPSNSFFFRKKEKYNPRTLSQKGKAGG